MAYRVGRVRQDVLDRHAPGGVEQDRRPQIDEGTPLARRGLEAWLDAFHVTPRRDLYPVLDHLAQAHGMRLAFKQLHAGYVASAVLSR